MKKVLLSIGLLSIAALFLAIRNGTARESQSVSATSSPFSASRAFEDMKSMVDAGPRPSGSPVLDKVRLDIASKLKKAGLMVQTDGFVAETPLGKVAMTNIRAVRKGTVPGSGTIVLTGHFDTKLFKDFKFVGASDGASSAAWLLEMARATSDLKLQCNLEFLFLDGEEAVVNWSDDDSRYGSRHDVARRMKDGTVSEIKALILVDMIGDKNLDIQREAQSTDWLTSIIWNQAHALGYKREFLDAPQVVEDDHLPYLQAHVPAVDIIDFDYPDWHKQSDTLDKVSGESLKKVGDTVYASLPEIDRRVSQAGSSK